MAKIGITFLVFALTVFLPKIAGAESCNCADLQFGMNLSYEMSAEACKTFSKDLGKSYGLPESCFKCAHSKLPPIAMPAKNPKPPGCSDYQRFQTLKALEIIEKAVMNGASASSVASGPLNGELVRKEKSGSRQFVSFLPNVYAISQLSLIEDSGKLVEAWISLHSTRLANDTEEYRKVDQFITDRSGSKEIQGAHGFNEPWMKLSQKTCVDHLQQRRSLCDNPLTEQTPEMQRHCKEIKEPSDRGCATVEVQTESIVYRALYLKDESPRKAWTFVQILRKAK